MSADGPTPQQVRLEALYTEHAAAVHAYARRRIDPEAAEDVVAETFLVAWRRLEVVPVDALPWLYATAANVLANQRRAAARRATLAARVAAQPPPSPVEEHDAGGDDDALTRALAALRPADREALLLLAWEGLTPQRAAAVVGCSRAAFHVRVHRARRRLAAELRSQRGAGASSTSLAYPATETAS